MGTKILLRAARAALPEGVAEEVAVLVAGERIERVLRGADALVAQGGAVLDVPGATLYPGFIDAHIHGALGVDVNEASAEDLRRVASFLAAEGVTSWLPTLVPAPEEDYLRAAGAVAQLMGEQSGESRPDAARALGLHYEGPFVNAAQCGALRTRFFRAYSGEEDLRGVAAVGHEGAVHMMTVAPEVEGGVELIRELARRGWVPSIGHTRADPDTLERAYEAGARHMTHFMNAMPQLHHRAPGPVGWGLTRDDVGVDVIADFVHLDPLALRLVLNCKGAGLVTLVSDAVAPAGLGDGEFRVWGETIKVEAGRTSNERGNIAGSVITVRDAVRNVLALGAALHEAARMASYNPARLLGLARECGSIEEGKRADLTALDDAGRVLLTLVGGRVAYRRGDG